MINDYGFNSYGQVGFIIHNLLDKLNPLERNIFCLTQGLGDGYCYSYEEIARILKMQEIEVRKVEERAEYKFNLFK